MKIVKICLDFKLQQYYFYTSKVIKQQQSLEKEIVRGWLKYMLRNAANKEFLRFSYGKQSLEAVPFPREGLIFFNGSLERFSSPEVFYTIPLIIT